MQTYVLEHDWGVLMDAARRELERGGQVYYLHNRVETITRTAARIKEMLGEDTVVAVAHGKMSQEELNAPVAMRTVAFSKSLLPLQRPVSLLWWRSGC